MIIEKVIRNYMETTLNGLCENAGFDFLFEGKVSFNNFKPHRKLNGKMAIPFMVEQELSQNLNDGFNSIRYVFTVHLLPYADIREKIEELQYYINQIFNGIQSLEIEDYKLSISLNGYNFGVDETNGFYQGVKSFAWNVSLVVDSSNEALTSSDIDLKYGVYITNKRLSNLRYSVATNTDVVTGSTYKFYRVGTTDARLNELHLNNLSFNVPFYTTFDSGGVYFTANLKIKRGDDIIYDGKMGKDFSVAADPNNVEFTINTPFDNTSSDYFKIQAINSGFFYIEVSEIQGISMKEMNFVSLKLSQGSPFFVNIDKSITGKTQNVKNTVRNNFVVEVPVSQEIINTFLSKARKNVNQVTNIDMRFKEFNYLISDMMIFDGYEFTNRKNSIATVNLFFRQAPEVSYIIINGALIPIVDYAITMETAVETTKKLGSNILKSNYTGKVKAYSFVISEDFYDIDKFYDELLLDDENAPIYNVGIDIVKKRTVINKTLILTNISKETNGINAKSVIVLKFMESRD